MTRSVKVELEAGVTKYIPPVKESTKTTEDFDDKVKKTNDDLNKTAPAAAKAAAAMKLLGDEGGKTKVALEDGIGKNSTSLGVLDQKLQAARAEVRRLADEFNRTGDATSLEKLFNADKAAKDLEKLTTMLAKDLTKGVQDGISTGGKEGAKTASASLQGGLSTPVIGPVITAAIIAGVVAALPVAVPMLNAALVTGGGLGILAGGIAGAFQSAQVKDAAGGLGSTLKSMFIDATVSFRNPVENALLDLTSFSRHLDLRSIFAPLAQEIGPLEQGIEGFLSRVVAGLGKFAEKMKPVLDVFIAHLPQLGATIENFLQRISRNANSNASALDMLLTVVENIIRVVGVAIEQFDNFYRFVINGALGVAVVLDNAFGWIPIIGKQLDENTKTLGRLATEANGGVATGLDNASTAADGLNGAIGPNGLGKSVLGTTTAMQQLDTATLQWKNDALDAKNASLQFKDGLANLKDQMANNKAGFDENSAAGRQNIEALNQLATSAQDVANKTYAATGNSQAAAQAYKDARDKVMDLAKQGHASADEINALNQALDNVVKIRKGSITLDVVLTGSGKALVTNQGTTILSGTGLKLQRYGGINYAADGLIGLGSAGIYPAMNRPTYGFAEPGTGGEGFVPRYGDYNRSTAIIDQEAQWYGGRFVPAGATGGAGAQPMVNVYVTAKDGASQAIMDLVDVRIEQADQRTAMAVAGRPRV